MYLQVWHWPKGVGSGCDRGSARHTITAQAMSSHNHRLVKGWVRVDQKSRSKVWPAASSHLILRTWLVGVGFVVKLVGGNPYCSIFSLVWAFKTTKYWSYISADLLSIAIHVFICFSYSVTDCGHVLCTVSICCFFMPSRIDGECLFRL